MIMNFRPLATVLEIFEHTRFYPGPRLFTWHPTGELDDSLADEIIGVVETDELFQGHPFNRYTDFSQLTTIRLKIGHMFDIAGRRRSAVQPVKSALFANTVVGLGIARLYEHLMKDAVIQVQTFDDRSAAAEWLEVPTEMLFPG